MHDLFQFYDERITKFADAYTSDEDDLAKEVRIFTATQHPEAHMLSGKQQGTFLKFVSCMMRPRRILEIGTFTGYSALCLAEGLTDDGELHTLEYSADTAAIAQQYFNRSTHASKIKLHVGDAKQVLPELKEIWDLVFIDADKPGYTEYLKLTENNIRKNGFVLADNIFFHGHTFEENPRKKTAKGIKEFNAYVAQNTAFEKLPLTIRDGLFILRKL